MRLEELYKVIREDVRMDIYTGCENEPIAVYNGRDSIPKFINKAEVFDIMPSWDNELYFKVILTAEYTEDIICAITEQLMQNALDDLSNGERVKDVLQDIEDFLSDIEEFRDDL